MNFRQETVMVLIDAESIGGMHKSNAPLGLNKKKCVSCNFLRVGRSKNKFCVSCNFLRVGRSKNKFFYKKNL